MMLRLLKQLPFLGDPSTRRALRQIPGIRQVRHAAAHGRRTYYRCFGQRWLKRKLAASESKRIVIGAWSKFDPGWIPTQRDFLDLTDPAQWRTYFEPNSVDAMLAEHVWEHITPEQGLAAAQTCHTYLKPGASLRIAVPDVLMPDPAYVDLVKADAVNPAPCSSARAFESSCTSISTNKAHSIARTGTRRVAPSRGPSVLIPETRTAPWPVCTPARWMTISPTPLSFWMP